MSLTGHCFPGPSPSSPRPLPPAHQLASDRTPPLPVESYPQGYPQLGCYLDSDDAFMMYRRFGQLHSRLLLHKQDRLRGLEEELTYLDQADAATPDGQKLLRCREDDDDREPPPPPRRSRSQLLDEIQTVLTEYGWGALLLQDYARWA